MLLRRIQILENQLFESLANARKLYSNKIGSEVFDELISIDTSKTYKYIEKICKFYLQNEDLDFEELKSNIELFDKLSSKNLIDIKDINQFKTYSSFKEYLDSNSDKMSKSEETKLIKNKGSEVVLNNDKYLVLLIKDEQAAIQYGSNTKWCISATDSKNYFKRYRKESTTFYFVFNKTLSSDNPLYKIAVAVYSSGRLECYDAIDNEIPCSEVGLPRELFKVKELSKEENLEIRIKGTYKINSQGLIDVDGDVDISNINIKSILEIGRFGTVTGNFNCSGSKLTSLDGSPTRVGGDFKCNTNLLMSLDGSPKEVGGNFECSFNVRLISLEAYSVKVGGTFDCSSNSLTSLDGSPTKVGKNFNCSFNKLESLEGCPEKIRGNFNCYSNNLTSLKGCPKEIGRTFNCSNNNLKTLKGCPVKVGGDFSCSTNKLTSLDGCPTKVGRDFSCSRNSVKFTTEDVMEICDVKRHISV